MDQPVSDDPEAAPEVAGLGQAQIETQTPPEAVSDIGTSARQGPDGPDFDVVRVAPDGQTVLAGRAAPGQEVEILLDGRVAARETADSSGKFVSVIFADLTGAPQQLQLRTIEPVVEEVVASPQNEIDTTSADAEAEEPQTEVALELPAAPETLTLPLVDAPVAAIDDGDADRPQQQAGDLALASPGVGPVLRSLQAAPEQVRVSAPVIILPAAAPDKSPTLVQPQRDELAVLQPGGETLRGVVLDRITYGSEGALQLYGRGRVGRAVRVYGNADLLGTPRVTVDGTWQLEVEQARAEAIKLLRMDEIDASGEVSSRIEAPFDYAVDAPKIVRERRVVIQRGDYLWRISEQFYGEGVRYSVIYGANTDLIRDPDLIYPGQVFTVPELIDAQ